MGFGSFSTVRVSVPGPDSEGDGVNGDRDAARPRSSGLDERCPGLFQRYHNPAELVEPGLLRVASRSSP
jgi:hypothetical protein